MVKKKSDIPKSRTLLAVRLDKADDKEYTRLILKQQSDLKEVVPNPHSIDLKHTVWASVRNYGQAELVYFCKGVPYLVRNNKEVELS